MNDLYTVLMFMALVLVWVLGESMCRSLAKDVAQLFGRRRNPKVQFQIAYLVPGDYTEHTPGMWQIHRTRNINGVEREFELEAGDFLVVQSGRIDERQVFSITHKDGKYVRPWPVTDKNPAQMLDFIETLHNTYAND